MITPETLKDAFVMIITNRSLYYILIPIALFFLIKFGIEYLTSKKQTISKENQYKSREILLTKAELEFYKKLLVEYSSDQYFVFSKVRLADIIEPADKENWGTAFNRIKAKHIDFVVTDHQSKILKAIELDDYTHNGEKRKERDSFVNEGLQGAGIEIVRV